MSEEGLYHKYDVVNHETGEEVRDGFVLRPSRDPHALVALAAYADSVALENPTLAGDLRHMVQRLGGISVNPLEEEHEAAIDLLGALLETEGHVSIQSGNWIAELDGEMLLLRKIESSK